MNNSKYKSFVPNSLIIMIVSTLITLSFANFSAKADSEITPPEAISGSSTTIYLPLIKQKPAYFLSPTGNDASSGTSEAAAWATFNHAWKYLYPGDTLILLDGVYRQTLNPNVRNGQPGRPITIRAKNDGKAIIDGENIRLTVKLGATFPGPIGNYFVLEGIVAKDSVGTVYNLWGDHNILRRVSGYNANTDTNDHVFVINSSAEYNLIEDCVAAGTGRKMVMMYKGENNVVRRCFASWQEWDGREWHDCWPWGDGIEIYSANDSIIENSITYSRIARDSISLLAQGTGNTANRNKILGTMSISAGMKEDGTPMDWGTTRPQPTDYTCVQATKDLPRVGYNIYNGDAEIKDNLWQDIFAWGSAGLGIQWVTSGTNPIAGNNRINRATFFNNGLDNPCSGWPCLSGGIDTDVLQTNLSNFTSIENSRIDKIFIDWPEYPNGERNLTSMNGEGARLTHRYINGVLTDQPLWPWPMEERIKDELGYSVTELMTQIIFGTTNLNLIYP